MDYYQEYLKYRSKYEQLQNRLNQNQRGGVGEIFPLADEIHFWAKQLMEHQLFLFLGLEDVNEFNMKRRAFEIHVKWKDFLNNNFYRKGVRVTNETVELSPDDLSKVGNIDINAVNDLINQTSNFTQQVIKTLAAGNWVGWIYPSLAKHMLEETEYFSSKVNGPAFSPDREIKYILHHHSGELAVTAQWIDPDPSQQAIIDLVRSYALKNMSRFLDGKNLEDHTGPLNGMPHRWTKADEAILNGMNPGEQASLLFLSIRYSREVVALAQDTGDKVKNNQLESIISPVVADHVLREFRRFTTTLERLQGSQAQVV